MAKAFASNNSMHYMQRVACIASNPASRAIDLPHILLQMVKGYFVEKA